MSRPARFRKIKYPPLLKGFIPVGVHAKGEDAINLLMEEYEAIRLMDYEHLNQVDAARQMGISRPTFTRIYDSARKKMAIALVDSREVVIEGGSVEFEDEWFRCLQCDTLFQVHNPEEVENCPNCKSTTIIHLNDELRKQPRRRHHYHQRMENQSNSSGFCICPRCGKRISHIPGKPCRSMHCSGCNITMIREDRDCKS